MKAFLVALAFTFGLLACHQQQAVPNCDCQSTVYSSLIEKTGIYNKNYVVAIDDKTGQFNGSYRLSCNPDFIIGKAADGDTIILSGRARQNCYEGESLVALPGLLELTAVRRK